MRPYDNTGDYFDPKPGMPPINRRQAWRGYVAVGCLVLWIAAIVSLVGFVAWRAL